MVVVLAIVMMVMMMIAIMMIIITIIDNMEISISIYPHNYSQHCKQVVTNAACGKEYHMHISPL